VRHSPSIAAAAIGCALFTLNAWALAGVQTAFTVVDVSTDFTLLYDRTIELPVEQRAAAFRSELTRRLSGFYSPGRFGADPERYDALMRASIEQFPKIRARFNSIAVEFQTMLAPAVESFRRVFDDLGPLGPVYLLHSLGELDGGTRTIDGDRRLVFGADVMAATHRFQNEQPFFHHELFHFYHADLLGQCQGVWCSLWREGLAVHVASVLNPRAGDDELLLTYPQPLRSAIDANLATAVCAVSANLDSTNNTPYFSSGRSLPGLPPRFGYYVGYLVAREAARTQSIQQLAHLSAQESRRTVADALARLAACPR
jgi:hypothetical protein